MTMTERVGQHLGNYHISRLLGTGVFADVYLGEHLYLNTQAAMKILHTPLGVHAQDSFLTEARYLSHLIHPHIIRVLEFGMQDQVPYLLMDYAPWGNLRQQHPQGTVVPLATVVSSQHLLAQPASLRERHPEIPPAVEQVVLKTLSKDPALRYVDVLSFANALEDASHAASLPSNFSGRPVGAAIEAGEANT